MLKYMINHITAPNNKIRNRMSLISFQIRKNKLSGTTSVHFDQLVHAGGALQTWTDYWRIRKHPKRWMILTFHRDFAHQLMVNVESLLQIDHVRHEWKISSNLLSYQHVARKQKKEHGQHNCRDFLRQT